MVVTPFAREVKRLRAAQEFTVRDLASEVGKSVAYIAKIEVQGEIPAPEFICTLSRVLNVDLAEMLRLAKEARLASMARAIDGEHARAMTTSGQLKQISGANHPNEKGAPTMATVVSMINMKGGVGKTTLA